MGYVDLGRKLGIGTRVAAKVLREHARNRAATASPAKPSTAKSPASATNPRQNAAQPDAGRRPDLRKAARNVPRGVARGTREFGRGFWRSFGHAAHALWHEITGVFFAIFAAFFAEGAWNMRGDWLSGPEHRHFWIYLIVAALFLYFSISAFIRSRRSAPRR